LDSNSNTYRSISLLFVEDEELTLKLQASILAAKFPDVTLFTAANGKLGLELFKAHSPEIVITDINMSEMCGVQMAENIRALKPDTKIIAITGRSGTSSKNGKFMLRNSEGKAIEFDHLIVKPVDLYELCDVIEQCIGEIELQIS
jgi:CheY-like chemotaxis protein